MRYLCLGYYDPDAYDAMSPEDKAALVKRCRAYDEELRGSGHLASVASLEHRVAVTLRPTAGGTAVTDGPFTEAKEVIGSFFIIEADDVEDAVRIASLHPAARSGENLGWAVEIRPIDGMQVLRP